jgi:hypothetical protein
VIFKDDLQKIFGKRPFDEVEEKVEQTVEEEKETTTEIEKTVEE